MASDLPMRGDARTSGSSVSSWWLDSFPMALRVSIYVVAYVAMEWVSFIHEFKGLPITPWNPGLGVMFAVMMFSGARYGIVLFIGAVVAEFVVLQSTLSSFVEIAISASIATGYTAAVLFARRTLDLDVGLRRLRDVIVLLVTGASGAILVAILLSLLLLLDAQLNSGEILFAAVPLLVGDVIGIAVMTPLTLRLASSARISLAGGWSKLILEVLLYVALAMAALWFSVGSDAERSISFFYLLFLPIVISSVRHGLDGACVGLALTQLALVGLSHALGYDATAFTEIQLLMLVLTTTGLIVGVVVSERRATDLLAREAEARLKQKEAEAAQAARLSLVSGMASALAHEINQPMTAARALGRSAQQILRTPGGDTARADNNLTTMIAQIDHAADVIRRMRDFLRRGRPHVSTIAVHNLLEDALVLVRSEAQSHGIRLELDAPNDLPPIYGDTVQLQQVLVNLVRNAMDAINGALRSDGCITIKIRRQEIPSALEVAVLDNGPGIDSELAKRLFEPLTTSKPEGLGLGLSICASIVESHGGRIWLESGRSGATEFRISLPLQPMARHG